MLLRQAESTIARVQALARGEYGELRIGYSPSASAGILPPDLAAFGKTAPEVKVVLHDLAGDELTAGLLDGSLHLAVMIERTDAKLQDIPRQKTIRSQVFGTIGRTFPMFRRSHHVLDFVSSDRSPCGAMKLGNASRSRRFDILAL